MSSTKQVQFAESGSVKTVEPSYSGTVTMTGRSTDSHGSTVSKPNSSCKGKACYCSKGRGEGLSRVPFLV